MKINKVNLLYFSPTGSTKRVLKNIAEVWSCEKQEVDLTLPLESGRAFPADELVLVGAPAYGGRVPAPEAERLHQMRGEKTPAVIVTAFGNRAYEDTLAELQDILQSQGFVVTAALAVVTEHSIMHEFAAGRPDEQDREEIRSFAEQIRKKLELLEEFELTGALLRLPGNHPYREYHGIPLKPKASRKCIQCGLCAAQCPVGAIPLDHPAKTDAAKCISCMRCVSFCPQQARSVSSLLLLASKKKLSEVCRSPKPNELYI